MTIHPSTNGRIRISGIAATTAISLLWAGTARAADSITVYSGQHEQTVGKLVKDFTKRTGVEVKLRSGGEAEMANQILLEGSSSPADVFIAQNPPALEVLREKGLFAPVDPATLKAVRPGSNSPQGAWVGVSARAAVLAYNTDQVKKSTLPKSLLDLAKPAWKGKFGFATTETDFQPLIAAVTALKGRPTAERWLTALKDQGRVYEDNEALVAAVNRGEIATGVMVHYYWFRLRDEIGAKNIHSALHYFAPRDPGALVDVSGAAALKSSKKAKLGQRFLAYLVSKPAQMIVATTESYEYPLGSGVTTTKPLRPFASLRPPAVSVSDLGNGRASLRLLQDVGLL